ncbi:MAG: hypothetical protein L6R37_005792 [Teloschistes peruensis]|nr:MAG: hypothetical protein L6R37_005792 [Teloschistes peruensis]
MTTSYLNPRRRLLSRDIPLLPLPDDHVFHEPHSPNSLKKSSTFHSPTTPPSPHDDPIVNIPLLPRRSPTCPRELQVAFAAGEKRLQDLLGAVDRSLSGLETFSTDSQETLRASDLPVPRCVLDAQAGDLDCMDVDASPELTSSPHTKPRPRHKYHHSSDSGIGSTVTDSEDSLLKPYATNKHDTHADSSCSSVKGIQSGINGAVGSNMAQLAGLQHALSEYACRHIQKHIISPIVAEKSLKDFHPLVRGIPYRVARKEITCLRDLEKVLLWLAPVSASRNVGERSLAHFWFSGVQKWSVSKRSFLNFCETTIQCLHTTIEHLNESDQRRPTDRPYTNGYFLDLTEQVRQYAAMITASRARMAGGKRMTDDDVAADERLGLHGGLSQNGRPAELVRIRNGQSFSLRTGNAVDLASNMTGAKRAVDEDSDEDPLRSMARRRKNAQAAAKEAQQCRDCDKVFKRPCDLTKHEKTHSRPWKCDERGCKYHTYGWPTEKERDRHVNDKHSASPSMYKCQFRPCPYESKRESNCKQHMEKAHGWAYVRSKNNGKSKKTQTGKTPPSPQTTTAVFDPSSPEYGTASSSLNYGGAYSVPPSVNGSEDSLSHSALNSPFMNLDERFPPFGAGFNWNESYDGFAANGPSPYTPSSHRLSFDAGSMTHAPTIPSSFENSIAAHDADPLFTENFDWSNIDTTNDFTSLNIQLITPANSTETRPMDAFSRNHSICLDQVPIDQIPSLSPGAQGNVMFYSPYSQNAGSIDEGYDDFIGDVGKPAGDFNLFDSAHGSSSIASTGNQLMFQDLSALPSNTWSGRGTELAQTFGMNSLMEVDEE